MKLISIQKKPTFYSELLMVFINSLYKLYQYKALMVRLKSINFDKSISIPSFQFLMVRLKANH